MSIEKVYKKFDVISVHQIPDCSSTGIYLRHKTTGLEVFHLLNNDEENLFAFAFRTPIKNSTGAAHIMEHSVFCGSEKFPLKEPFTNMMNQSVNTFLNALTYTDKTVYPASSMNRADYFNLLDVYGDAVFFPLLKKEAFIQEGHRLEIDGKGNFSIQGVVYNEMKGNYSSFESVASDIQVRSLFAGSNYAYDSGGDPLEIPSFTYEDFKAFHKKYYRPENCLVFLYGNIPTEEQLDFLQENFLDRLEKIYPVPQEHSQYPFVPEEFTKIETSDPIEEPIKISALAPHTGATGATVSINWRCGETKDIQSFIECGFLSEILAGHDGSPLTKALIESELGDDLAPIIGTGNETRNFTMSFGLHGVNAKNEQKVYDLILSTLKNLVKTGIDSRDIQAALMSAEFANREIVRAGGPYSLVLLDRVLNGWNYGRNPAEMLYFQDEIENIRKKLKKNPDFVAELIKKHLLENNERSYVMVSPSKAYLADRKKQEKKLLAKFSRAVDCQQVQKDTGLLHKYQAHHETSEETACIPKLNPSDLKSDVETINTELSSIKMDDSEITAFKNVENTNGIAYLSVAFPVDVLSPEDYKYLPLYSYCATNIGWGEKDWSECAGETAVATGGIVSRLMTANTPDTENTRAIIEQTKNLNFNGRDWLVFSVKFIREKMDEALNVFSECLTGFHFTDEKRIKTLVGEALASMKSGVIPKGHRFSSRRVQCTNSHASAVEEIWYGISQLFSITGIAKANTEETMKRLESFTGKLFQAGALVQYTADEATVAELQDKLPDFAKKTGLLPLMVAPESNDEQLFAQLSLPGEEKCVSQNEFFTIDSQVGFVSKSFKSYKFGQKENAVELLLAHWLSGNFLWERIRTTGGAYGAFAGSANLSGNFICTTFRDPNPVRSAEVFDESLYDFSEMLLDKEECDRNITGTYGDEVQPHSPSGRGSIGFLRKLYSISDADRQAKIQNLLNADSEQLREVAKKIFQNKNSARTVIIGNINNKNAKKTGVIIKLPL